MNSPKDRLLQQAQAVADGSDPVISDRRSASEANLSRLSGLARLFGHRRLPEPPFDWAGLQVREVIGSGGFGTVYRARDPVLARDVALKLIEDGAVADDEFIAEARRLARVRHPNVLSIHGVESDRGRVGLWADVLEGRTLEQRLAEGPLAEPELLSIAEQLISALRAVHAAGLVHGDVKAGNVMVGDRGHLTLMDFGAAHRADGGLLRFGSPRNMAPECFEAECGSCASDIYESGALLYRLASGQHAFPASERSTLLEMKRAGTFDKALLGRLSRPLRRLITAMLAPDPADRPDIEAVSRRLSWIQTAPVRRLRLGSIAAGLACVLVIAAWLFGAGRSPPEASGGFEASVAVLPFDDLDGGKAAGEFVTGLSDSILHALSGVPGLKVTGRYSSNAADGDRAQLADKLGVDHLLHGSVRRDGEALRVFAELVRATDGMQVWSETFDRRMDDVFRIQDSIASEVAEALRGVSMAPGRSDARRTDVDNYEIYLRGLSLLNRRGADNVLQSIEYFRDVVERDPGFAPAWSGLASAYAVLPSYMNAPPDSGEEARQAARRAIELDPDDALALGVLATQHAARQEWVEAERLYRRALAAEPGNSTIRMWYGELMAETGRLDAKREQLAMAVELDPLAPAQRGNYGWALLVNRNFAGAERECRIAWDFGLQAMFVWTCVHDALLFQQDFEAAERWVEHMPLGAGAKQGALRLVAVLRDADAEQTHRFAMQLEDGAGTGMPVENAAMALGLLGETETAWSLIDRAVSAGEYDLVRSLFAPHFAALQDDPRFVGLMERLGLIDYWRSVAWGPVCKPIDEAVECRSMGE